MTSSLPRLYCHNTMTAPIGLSVKRREDRRLLTGRGHYVDDVRLPHLCHAAIVRSPHAHARILDVDARRATALPGVAEVPAVRPATPARRWPWWSRTTSIAPPTPPRCWTFGTRCCRRLRLSRPR